MAGSCRLRVSGETSKDLNNKNVLKIGQVALMDTERQIDEEIKRRKALIGSFPRVIAERVKSLGLEPGEIEVKIQQLNGLFVDVRRKTY